MPGDGKRCSRCSSCCRCWSSYLVRVFAWRIILGKAGILNWILIKAGILDTPSPVFVYNLFSMGLTLCYIWLPFMILPLVTAFERLPRNLLEASADLGADGLTTFRRVTLPLVMPGLLAGSLSVFSLTSGDYITPALIGGPGDSLVGNVIAGQFGVASNYPLGLCDCRAGAGRFVRPDGDPGEKTCPGESVKHGAEPRNEVGPRFLHPRGVPVYAHPARGHRAVQLQR